MYSVCTIQDTIRVLPKNFGGNLKKAILTTTQQEYEGLLDEDLGIIVTVIGVENIGEGRVIPGDGAAYYNASIQLLVYKPELKEVVEGAVSQITEFGAFIQIGPIDGLIHVSQIMDDYINYEPKTPCFNGKETAKKLKLNDDVLARVVTVSLKGNLASSKIGLTMRQEGLGKEEWEKMDAKIKKAKEKKKEEKKPQKKGDKK